MSNYIPHLAFVTQNNVKKRLHHWTNVWQLFVVTMTNELYIFHAVFVRGTFVKVHSDSCLIAKISLFYKNTIRRSFFFLNKFKIYYYINIYYYYKYIFRRWILASPERAEVAWFSTLWIILCDRARHHPLSDLEKSLLMRLSWEESETTISSQVFVVTPHKL